MTASVALDPHAIDPAELEAAVGKVFGELSVSVTAPLVVLGDRLNLWRALAGSGPLSASELAHHTGLVERYVREWLRGVTVAGYLSYDPETGTFTLADAMAAVLASDVTPTSLVGVFSGFTALWADLDHVEGFFRSGGGMGWGDHHPSINEAQARFTRPAYVHGLIAAWIPAVAGIVDTLRTGATVADVGCGFGVSTILAAQEWPASRFFGFDTHSGSIDRARQDAAAGKVSANTRFEVADARSFPSPPQEEAYDLVLFSDSLHDLGDPVAAVAHARTLLAPDGVLLLIEPLAADRLEDDFSNPYARIGYAISTLICTPSSLAQPGGAALGAMAGEARLREVLAAGGYTRVRRIAEDSAPFNIILEARA